MAKALSLEDKLASDKKPVKVGEDSTGLLLADNDVFVEKTPTEDYHVATKKYVDSLSPDTVTYYYETKICNFYATATANYLPLVGYVVERTSTTGMNEYIAMVAPYDGRLVKAMFRSESTHNGSLEYDLVESSDGTEVPGSVIGNHATSINIADDTSQTSDFTLGMTSGSNALTKGRIYAVKLTTPSAPNDTNVTLVFRWDVTS